MPRAFRNPESLETETRVRAALIPFLQERGFVVEDPEQSGRRVHGKPHLVSARDEQGRPVTMWVKLCWRKNRMEIEDGRSAAQLMARIGSGDWVGKIQTLLERIRARGATHLLLVQDSGDEISLAVSVPLHAVLPIWELQRDESKRLIDAGAVSHTKNHAENGTSPTIWLRDEGAPSVAQQLWNYSGVRDLEGLSTQRDQPTANRHEDSESDLPDYSNLGSDGAPRVPQQTSGVRRDPRVRAAVQRRSGRRCESPGCNTTRDFSGFFDVHHILGAEKGDRYWNCITLCPNCHRETHYAPNHEELNSRLLEFAARWKPLSP